MMLERVVVVTDYEGLERVDTIVEAHFVWSVTVVVEVEVVK